MAAASMWRMNASWRGMAVALLFCVLLLNNGVMCQDDATDAPGTTDSPGDAATDTDPQASVDPDATAAPGDTAGTATGGATGFTVSMIDLLSDSGAPAGGDETSGTSGTVGPAVGDAVDTLGTEATDAPAAVPETQATLLSVLPVVECVEKEAMANRNSVKATVTTHDCEETKSFLQGIPAAWCASDTCRLDVFQEGNKLLMASPDAQMNTLVDALKSEHGSGSLGASEIEPHPASSGSSVFVAVLLTGLLLAAALIGGYCLKIRRGASPKGMRLAEEAYPADETNQGNTLVSVAPLNPPAETPEKPSVNGEAAPEAEKTQPPPTNGHSTAKNADTEL